MGRDPAFNNDKQLVVDYEIDGRQIHKTVLERQTLVICDQPVRVWDYRKTFSCRQGIRQATIYATALGLYEMHLNGNVWETMF